MRDFDPIVGDLLEEYREVMLPSRGRVGAALWLARQMASLVRPWMWGCILGLTLGGENLLMTAVSPLAEDTPLVMLSLVALVLGSLTLIGAAATRQRHRVWDGITAGIVAAVIGSLVVSTANYIRVTTFVEVIQYRSDWVGLMQRFHASGSSDLRGFVSAEYLRGMPMGFAGSAIVGALAGAIGGLWTLRRLRPWFSTSFSA